MANATLLVVSATFFFRQFECAIFSFRKSVPYVWHPLPEKKTVPHFATSAVILLAKCGTVFFLAKVLFVRTEKAMISLEVGIIITVVVGVLGGILIWFCPVRFPDEQQDLNPEQSI